MRDATGETPGPLPGDGPPGMPRWVKVGALVLGLLLLLLLALHLTGVSSGHGPGQHISQPDDRGVTISLRSGPPDQAR